MNRTRFLKNEWPQLLILAAPFVILPLIWSSLPERVPIHWNFSGNPNGYADKGFGLLFIPLINIALAALLGGLAKVDPKAFLMNLPSVAIKPTIAPAVGMDVNQGTIFQIGFPLLFLLMGNFLPTLKPNYFIGVRTPWTLESPENWRLTHKFSGRLWVIASVAYLLLNFVLPQSVREAFQWIYFAVIIVPPLAYSYVIFQKSKRPEVTRTEVQA